jgi:hypothetical protein
LLGLGVAGLALGATTTGLALHTQDDLDRACLGGTCPPSFRGEVDRYDTTKTLSIVGWSVGVVTIAGVGLLLGGYRRAQGPR